MKSRADEVIGKSVKDVPLPFDTLSIQKVNHVIETKQPLRYLKHLPEQDQYWDIFLCAPVPGFLFAAWADITDFIKKDPAISQKHPWLETLLNMFTMTSQNIEDVIHYALQKSMQYTGSLLGNLVLTTQMGQPCGLMLAPKMRVTGIVAPKLWETMQHQREPLIINDPEGLGFLEGVLPSEHIPVERLLIVPVFKGKELFLLGILANKSSDYSCFEAHQFSLFMKGVCRILDQRQSQEQLENNEKYFRSIIENSSDIVIVLDYSASILYISPSVFHVLGYLPEELTGKSALEFISIKSISEVKQNLIKAKLAGGGVVRDIIPIKSKNGDWHYFEIKSRSLPPESQVAGVVVNARDVTALKIAERTLRECKDKYSKLFNMAGDAIFIVDAETGVIMEVNKRAQKLTGLPENQIVGKQYLDFFPENERSAAQKIFHRLAGIKRKLIANVGENLMIHASGQFIPVEISVSIINIRGKDHYLGICRDLTNRKRLEDERLQKTVAEATREAEKKITSLKKLAARSMGLREIYFSSPAMQNIISEAYKYHQARSIPVLIQGETGTGKELIARLIHLGELDDLEAPFIAVNCAAINPALFESEFFGYDPGAFTGGLKSGQKGKFDLAQAGTIFLDEIAEISIELQSKLLRVIEEKEFYRVGGLNPVKTDARIICATNVDISHGVQAGTFRKDLYYRLSIGHIIIPPLRERKSEILPIALMYLQKYAAINGKKFKNIDPQAARILLAYPWPGNIRELKNLMEWVALIFDEEELRPFHLKKLTEVQENVHPGPATSPRVHPGPSGKRLTPEALRKALELTRGNISQTAKYLGVSRPTVYKYRSLYKL